MITLAATLLLAILPQGRDVLRERVDVAEVNHYYDGCGKLIFDQIIYYDWSDPDARYNVRAWRLIKHPSQVPCRDWQNGGYSSLWQDGDVYRQVQSESFRETWGQYDPEVAERDIVPRENRRELRLRE